ncbi:stanniocalcin-like protein [Plakobranchus ocellatus]|uniref:Stanniocalcin-like protein n=1 Tax=Plakobranchus ocellatus TaxID=259542 RepID=A0AAV4BGN6_9GAST|nr:stanniocalcin-like protein [Plakobranchus ocellatus]
MSAKLLILAVLANASYAFLFTRTTPVAQAEGREVDETCLARAAEGDCEFYNCFEQRLPCGRDYYMLRQGHYYCNKMNTRKHLFTPAGQQFIENVQQCLMGPLQEIYTREFIDCHTLEHEAVAAIAPCFNEHNFCDTLETDSEEFFRVYEIGDLFTRGATKIWRAIFQIAGNCGTQMAREFTSDTSESLMSSINGFFSSLGNIIENNDSEAA